MNRLKREYYDKYYHGRGYHEHNLANSKRVRMTVRNRLTGKRQKRNSRRSTNMSAYSPYIKIGVILTALALLAGISVVSVNAIINLSYPLGYSELVETRCERFGVDESLIYAIIRTESGFDPDARSDVGALGLMQITPDTFYWLQTKLPYDDSGSPLDEQRLLDPEVNITYGVFFISKLREEFGSDTLAVAAYHAGRGQMQRWILQDKLTSDSDRREIPSVTTGHYVSKVEKARDKYIKLYYD